MGTRKRFAVYVCSLAALTSIVFAAASINAQSEEPQSGAAAALGIPEGITYELSADEAAGPDQPIEYSHELHAGQMGIDCLYCHTGADKGQHATIPAVSVCIGCHATVRRGPSSVANPGSSEAEIAKIYRAYCSEAELSAEAYATLAKGEGVPPGINSPCKDGESIPWIRIHDLPEYVQFRHQRHVNAPANLECQTCHGPIETMKRVYLFPDTVLRPSSAYLPAQKLEMGWCLNCHLERGVTDDCAACHY